MFFHRPDLTSSTSSFAVPPVPIEVCSCRAKSALGTDRVGTTRTSVLAATTGASWSGQTLRAATAGLLVLALLLIWSAPGFAESAAFRGDALGHGGPRSPAMQISKVSTIHRAPSILPSEAQGPISAVLGRDESRYWVQESAGHIHAKNPRHALSIDFTQHGVDISNNTARWRLALLGYGYGDALHVANGAIPHAKANRVAYARGELTEWYVNGPLGLEQGFTLTKPPGRAKGRPLTVALAMSGDLTAKVDPNGTALTLTQRNGQAALRFTGLTAHDAIGRELRSSLGLRGEKLLLQVDDTGAQYPLTVDPFVQQAKLTATDGSASDIFGSSVAVSGDGRTVVVGAFRAAVGSNANQGAIYVFVEPTTGWAGGATQAAKLTASDGAFNDLLGRSVAISSDGSTVVAGTPGATLGANTVQGAVYVFVKPVTGWPAAGSEAAKLTASVGAQFDSLGSAVAVSSDGSMVVAGSPGVNSTRGELYLYVEPATGWAGSTTQTAALTASDAVSGAGLGFSVAINSTGHTIVGGAQSATVGSINNAGAAYVFVEPTTGWASNATQTVKLTASDAVLNAALGASVSISGDGNTVVAGASNINLYRGAVYVFLAPPSGWVADAQQTSELSASDGASGDLLGSSVAVSADGRTVVAGAPSNLGLRGNFSFNPGAAYVFAEPTTGWATSATEMTKLIASEGADGDQFGFAVAIDSNGSNVLVGANQATIGSNASQGAAYVFGPPPLMLACSTGTGQAGVPYGSALVASGGVPPYTFAIASGSLPLGLTLTPSTGAITGTPTTGGTVSFMAQVADSSGSAAGRVTSSCTISVNRAPAITSPNSASFSVGLFGSFTVTATGFPAPTFSAKGLPGGLSLSTGGQLSGTPAAGTAGSYAVVITASNGVLPNATQNFKLTVSGPPVSVTPAVVAFGTVPQFSVRLKTVTLANTGKTPVSISSVSVTPVAGTRAIDFTPINLCGSSLAAGQHCAIIVVFLAADSGPLSAKLNIVDNAAGSPQAVPLDANVVKVDVGRF